MRANSRSLTESPCATCETSPYSHRSASIKAVTTRLADNSLSPHRVSSFLGSTLSTRSALLCEPIIPKACVPVGPNHSTPTLQDAPNTFPMVLERNRHMLICTQTPIVWKPLTLPLFAAYRASPVALHQLPHSVVAQQQLTGSREP